MTNASQPDVTQRVRQFLEESIGTQDFSDDDPIFEKGFVNSMFALQLVSFTEKTFGIEVDDDDLELNNFKSVNAVADFVQRKQAS